MPYSLIPKIQQFVVWLTFATHHFEFFLAPFTQLIHFNQMTHLLIRHSYHFLYSSSLFLILLFSSFYCFRCFFNSNFFTSSSVYFAPSILIRKILTALKSSLLPTALALPHLFLLYNVFVFLAFHNHSFTLLFDPRARCFIRFHSFFLVYISF